MAAKKRADVLLHIDERANTPLYLQIYGQVREAIFTGTLAAGDRLTSIRRLSSELGVSHTTVEQAYLQLATEGLVANVPRSGYVVSDVDADFITLVRDIDSNALANERGARDRNAFYAENRSGGEARYDFSYANLQPGSFPANAWRKLTSDVLYRADCPELARYSYTDEPGSLHIELASLLSRTRGVNCLPDQILTQAGTDGALSTVLQLFDRDCDVLGMEEPGYATVREVAKRLGFRIAALPADKGTDAFLSALEKHKPRVVFTTPSHQFPTGKLLSLDGRTKLLKWAETNGSYIIEDDSCNEFRYSTRPIPSLQSLDVFDRVIYLCNVSKVLSPALRIAYLVLPPELLARYWSLFNYAHPPVSWLDQEVLARFMASGQWDAHVRRTAKGNHRRHDELLRCLRASFGDSIVISGTNTGMHLYVSVQNGMTQEELLDSAAREGAKVYGTARMWFSRRAPEENVMIGFSAIAHDDIEPGVAALARAWRR
ncbi:MAG: PLP-dependent aminotransferase family protein [Eggerthellaceae bacterium]|nr:PLP-dependent aminotransferase family protein [Eggerthellaceae bacterium]